MFNLDILANSQIISQNPVLKKEEKSMYFMYLLKYVRYGGWQKRKTVKAQLILYADTLLGDEKAISSRRKAEGKLVYRAYIPFDICAILGYDRGLLASETMQKVLDLYFSDFSVRPEECEYVRALIETVSGESENVEKARNCKVGKAYFQRFMNNLAFVREKPYKILVTATMSAGKSTFINSLVGKNISLSQNMACTSKIHAIVGKLYDDGFSYEYDHDLVMNAENEEILTDNDENLSDKIVVGTYYDGELGGLRLVIHDSPGVNFSENARHGEITKHLIRAKDYNMLIYVMNATQLGTEDEDVHLEYVKKFVGRTPVLFVINKIDAFNSEDEEVSNVIARQTEYLRSKGFGRPIVCPVSSRAAYLSKKQSREELSRIERRELYNYVDKFQEIDLTEYYGERFPSINISDMKAEEKQLLKTCGFRYIEEIIKKYTEGEKVK